jgi:hypothetical protein
VILPAEMIKNFSQLVLFTEIHVFGEERILLNESGLTTPLTLQVFNDQHQDLQISINYKIDEVPGFEYVLSEVTKAER